MSETPGGVPIDAWPEATLREALRLIRQYGEDAGVIAIMRATELVLAEDAEGLAEMDAVIACIEQLNSSGSSEAH